MAYDRRPLRERILSGYMPLTESGCWIWEGAQTFDGYGKLSVGNKNKGAHRVAYQLFVGEIPNGLHLDHLCRVRCCINPYHLEPVTCRENLLRGDGFAAAYSRKTHCKHGHEFTLSNTRVAKRGTRHCRMCDKERYEKRKAIKSF